VLIEYIPFHAIGRLGLMMRSITTYLRSLCAK
jgi:hypothetical protein